VPALQREAGLHDERARIGRIELEHLLGELARLVGSAKLKQ
jgi:hypothetical protein